MRPAHTLITFSGDLATLQEQWSYGLRFSSAGDYDTPAAMATLAADAGTSWAFWMAAHCPTGANLRQVKAARIGSDGHVELTADGGYVQGVDLTVRAGSLTGDQHPLQTALAVSLLSARAGATGKGRIFLPYAKVSLDATGRISTAQQTAVNTAVKGFINALNAQAPLGDCVVASSKGYLSKVTGVRTGRVVDTLRSRRRSQLEEYVTVAL